MRTRGDLMFRSHLPASRLLRLRDALLRPVFRHDLEVDRRRNGIGVIYV
jgi:hypothetical protein